MEQLTSLQAQRDWTRAHHRAGETIAFVPTMGALHEGHLSLVRQARQACTRTVVSIYVNPTQFDNPDDLAKYPRTLARDLELLEQAGVDAVYLPDTAEMYPDGYCTFVEVVGPLSDKLCAVARPGHFRGVATVVAKLLNAVQPEVAIFGEKDLQQVLIISRLVADLQMPVEIRVGETVREADGLAMSSRNRRLTPAMREKALALPRGLELARRAFRQGESSPQRLSEIAATELLCHDGVDVDYCDLVDLRGFKEAETADDHCVLAAAAFVDGVRLIDHVHLGGPALPVDAD
jgi:pantoate--beta-alanine ligase